MINILNIIFIAFEVVGRIIYIENFFFLFIYFIKQSVQTSTFNNLDEVQHNIKNNF